MGKESLKRQRVTELRFNEMDNTAEIYTQNLKLKRRLQAYAKKYPKLCKVTEKKRNGAMRFVIDKQRISIRLTAPYSEERREAASQYAKENSKIMQKNEEDDNGTVYV